MEAFKLFRRRVVYPEGVLMPSSNMETVKTLSWCTPPSPPTSKGNRKKGDYGERTPVIYIKEDKRMNLDLNVRSLEEQFRLITDEIKQPRITLGLEKDDYYDMRSLKGQESEIFQSDQISEKLDRGEPFLEAPQSPVPSSPSKKASFLKLPDLCHPTTTLDPQGFLYICWLFAMTFAYSYNVWAIPLRATFPYQTKENTIEWFFMDYMCDLMYIADVLLMKPRLMYLHEGFWVDNPDLTKKNYWRKIQYKFDLISLLPLDILYFYFGTSAVLLRFPRLLKLQTFWEFHQTMDKVLSSPYLVRIGKTLFYIFFLIHLNACAYYEMSVQEGLGSNGWVYDGQGSAYIRCFYFATKTATSIGKNPKPENAAEYLFMTAAWLMGVFVFALLIGQIRDIIATATRAQSEYRKLVDSCARYMRRLNMPPSLQRRVSDWITFTWNTQRCFDESRILDSLPINMKRDVSLAVHMSTLSKVQLFQDCDPSFLRDLVLQLRPVSFLPGDRIVRAGDVGNEMYIVKMGELLVMSPDEKTVLATLREGSVFGEISLLGIDGMRRRTASVRSRGYSNLFALSKQELEVALEQHPDATRVLRRRADNIIRQNAERTAILNRRNAEKRRRRRHEDKVSSRSNSLASSCGGIMKQKIPTIILTEEP